MMKIHAILMTDVVQSTDVRMGKFGNGLRFALQALPQIRIGRETCGQYLDGNISFEPCVARSIYLAHTARAQRREDFVGAEFCAGS